jgi:hypothetical protein
MDNGFGVSKGMGGTGIAFASGKSLNNLNPASYSGLDSLSFIFEIGTYGKYTSFKSSSETAKKFDGNIRYLTIGFRFTDWWAGSLGAVPYSSVGYNINSIEYVDGDLTPYYKTFKGEGGISQFYYANSVNLGKHIALGLNTSYLLGSITQTESVSSISDYDGYTLKKTNYVNSLIFDYGIRLNTNIGKLNYSLGLIYGNQKNLKSRSNIYFGTSDDTVELKSTKTKYMVPQHYGAGISVSNGKNFLAGFDYSTEKWSVSNFSNLYLKTRDGEKYSFGVEYNPRQSVRDYGFRNLYYRIGGYYQSTYLVIDNTPVDTKAITFGIGMPLKKKLSLVNLSAELGQTGSTKNGLIRESYIMLHLNFTLNDIWFQKPQYD